MERRKFTREFKLAAVKLIRDRGVSYVRPRRTWACISRCCAIG
jgi:transposase-like protein